jgi:protocatechuate 3,4-dioxygenase beta subunit
LRIAFWTISMLVLAGLAAWLTAPVWQVAPTQRSAIDARRGPDEPRNDGRRGSAPVPVAQIAPAAAPPIPGAAFVAYEYGAAGRRTGGGLPSSLVIAVRDALDMPLAGVRITLRPGTPDRRSAVTGSSGEVGFDRLDAGRYPYHLEGPGQWQARAAGALELAAGEMRRVELQLAGRNRAIFGRVLDRQGTPVAGLEVKARLYRPARDATVLIPRSQARQRSETGDDGWFEIAGLEDGEYQVRTVPDGFHDAATAIVRAGAEDVVLSVARRAELRVYGRVTTATGVSLADVRVAQAGSHGRRARTDHEGRYELVVAGDEADHEQITFNADGYLAQRLDVAAAEPGNGADRHLDVMLAPIEDTVKLTAQLTDEGGAPVPGERVYLYSRGLGTHYQTISGSDGSVIFPKIAAGSDYDLRISPRGPYRAHSERALDLSVDMPGLAIVLQTLALGHLSGRMVDAEGRPVPDFGLRITSADAPARWRQVSGDADGYFELDEVPEGELILQAASMPRLRIDGVMVDAAADTYAELVLDWGTVVLDGRVVDADGRAVASARVDLYWEHERDGIASRALWSTFTDSAGRFGFSRLGPAATRRLVVSAADQAPIQQTVAAERSWVEVRLRPPAEFAARSHEP